MQFAPPNLLCAHAVTATGDPDLPNGQHLRIIASPGLGLPVAPFLIWQTALQPRAEAKSDGGLVQTPLYPSPNERIIAAAGQGEGALKLTVIVEDAEGQEVGRKSQAPWAVAAPIVHRVRTQGGNAANAITLVTAKASDFQKIMLGDYRRLAMPIAGKCAWYAGGVDQGVALDRVKAGAPRRLTALDRPTGPYTLIAADAEVARIKTGAGLIDAMLESLLRSGSQPPAMRVEAIDAPAGPDGPAQFGEQPLSESLLLSTIDPGFARYAGFAEFTEIPGTGVQKQTLELRQNRGGTIWVVGLFAMAPDALTTVTDVFGNKITMGTALLPVTVPDEAALIQRLVKEIPGLGDVQKRAQKAGLQIRALLTVAAAVPPPDYLASPKPQIGSASWIGRDDGPSTEFRQDFRFPPLPFAATMAMSDKIGASAYEPIGEAVDTKAPQPARYRRRVMLIGRDNVGPLASHAPVPAEPGAVYFRFALGDVFGRYGKSSNILVAPPARPAPPEPKPQISIVRGDIDLDATGKLSPGVLTVVVPVPAVTSLAAGALPIATLEFAFDGASKSVPAAAGSMTIDLPLPGLLPQAIGQWMLGVSFLDDANVASTTAVLPIKIVDGRRPKPIKAAPGIIWTSQPGPSPEVELNLFWPAVAGQMYRAYLADARGLGVAGHPTRAEIGYAGVKLQQDKTLPENSRRLFRLLTDPPIVAQGATATLSTTLPRASTGVSFLKVVPVTAEGVEADFDACEFVPVAIPTDHRPPAPRLSGIVAPDGRSMTLEIEATGMNLVALQAAEPGLFASPPVVGARAPEFRLRRATGAVNDPLYARLVGTPGPLTLTGGAAPSLSATRIDAGDGGLRLFVRCTWWAEVRLPAERRLPADVTATPIPGGLTAEQPSQTRDMSRPFSVLSAPFSTVPVPAQPPAALKANEVVPAMHSPSGFNLPFDKRDVTVTIAAPPVADPAAIGPYRILLWLQWTGGAIELIADSPTGPGAFQWTGTFLAKPQSAKLAIVIQDPIGRRSPPLTFELVNS